MPFAAADWLLPIARFLTLRLRGIAAGSCCIALLRVSALALQQAPPPWLEQYEKIVARLRSGDAAGAIAQFEALWQANPQQEVLADAIGSALDSAGAHADATPWYQKAIKLNPQSADAYNNLALNCASRGQFSKARELLEETLRLRPSDAGASYNLGLVELRLNNFPAAARAFSRAHKLKPRDGDPLLRLAYAEFKAGDRQAGLSAIDEFDRLAVDRERSALQEAQILNAAGLNGEALGRIGLAEKAKRTSATTTDLSALSYQKALALFGLGRYKECVGLLSGAAANAQDPDWALLLGSAQALDGDLPEAAKTLQATVQLAPHQPEPYYRLALVLMQGYRDQDSLEVLDEGLKEVPNSPLLWYAMGVVDQVSGRYQQAIESVRKSLAAEQVQPPVWAMLADLYQTLGEYPKAEQSYQRAIKLRASPEVLASYAELLVKLKRLNEAESVLDQPSTVDRKDENINRAWGQVYSAKGQYGRAQAFLERAISADPDDADAHFALANCLQRLGKTAEAREEYAIADKQRHTRSTRLLRRTLARADESRLAR